MTDTQKAPGPAQRLIYDEVVRWHWPTNPELLPWRLLVACILVRTKGKSVVQASDVVHILHRFKTPFELATAVPQELALMLKLRLDAEHAANVAVVSLQNMSRVYAERAPSEYPRAEPERWKFFIHEIDGLGAYEEAVFRIFLLDDLTPHPILTANLDGYRTMRLKQEVDEAKRVMQKAEQRVAIDRNGGQAHMELEEFLPWMRAMTRLLVTQSEAEKKP